MCVCICVCVCVCISVRLYIYIYIHIHTYTCICIYLYINAPPQQTPTHLQAEKLRISELPKDMRPGTDTVYLFLFSSQVNLIFFVNIRRL